VATISSPRELLRASGVWRGDGRASIIILLIVALVIPLLGILLLRPTIYDGFRHILFVIPVICLLLYFGFIGSLCKLRGYVRASLILLAVLGLIESAFAMRLLHPYEYAYFNPLVNPERKFELEYWGTSFRALAEQLNDLAIENAQEGWKVRLSVCGPVRSLATFLNPDRFEIVERDAESEVMVVLNRWDCMTYVKKPWLVSVGRRNLLFAVAARR
jgi:hypothetical protein